MELSLNEKYERTLRGNRTSQPNIYSHPLAINAFPTAMSSLDLGGMTLLRNAALSFSNEPLSTVTRGCCAGPIDSSLMGRPASGVRRCAPPAA